MKKEFTKLISIVASEQEHKYENYSKLPSNKELKEVYLESHQHVAIKVKPMPTASDVQKAMQQHQNPVALTFPPLQGF